MVFPKFVLLFPLLAALCDGIEEQDSGHDSSAEYHVPEEEKPKPYHFGYEIEDHHGSQHRHEHSDADGTVKGSYGFVDALGVHRLVNYVADDFGFRAQVITNEQGTTNDDPADVLMHSIQKQLKPYPYEESKPYSHEESKPYSHEESKPYSHEESKPYSHEQSKPYSNEQSKPYSNEQSKPSSHEASKDIQYGADVYH